MNSMVFILKKEFGYNDLRVVHRLDKLTSGVCILAKVRNGDLVGIACRTFPADSTPFG